MKEADAIDLILKQMTMDETERNGITDTHGNRAILLAKKAGEVIDTSIGHRYDSEGVDTLRAKVVQAGALALRFLMSFSEES